MARISKQEQAKIKQKIVDVANVKFQELGYDQTSTKEIAKEVGIAEGTLFNYFDSKTDLFLEIFSDEFIAVTSEEEEEIFRLESVTLMLIAHIQKAVGIMLKMPRAILGELTLASIKMAKKNPKRFKKFVEIDFQYMNHLELFLNRLVQKQFIIEVDTKQLSELVYSVFMFEFILYAYDHSIDKEDMMKRVTTKIEMIMKGYIQGGQYEH